MVYEEGKLYERVLLQVLVYIFSFGISLLICGRGGDFVLKLPFYGAPLYMPYFLHVLYFLWLNLEFSHTHREEEQLSCFSTLCLRKIVFPKSLKLDILLIFFEHNTFEHIPRNCHSSSHIFVAGATEAR